MAQMAQRRSLAIGKGTAEMAGRDDYIPLKAAAVPEREPSQSAPSPVWRGKIGRDLTTPRGCVTTGNGMGGGAGRPGHTDAPTPVIGVRETTRKQRCGILANNL